MNRRRIDLSGPPLPTMGRSAEIGQRRSAWSRTERRTCAGGTSTPRGPAARSSSFSRAKSAATSVGSSVTPQECKEGALRLCKRDRGKRGCQPRKRAHASLLVGAAAVDLRSTGYVSGEWSESLRWIAALFAVITLIFFRLLWERPASKVRLVCDAITKTKE